MLTTRACSTARLSHSRIMSVCIDRMYDEPVLAYQTRTLRPADARTAVYKFPGLRNRRFGPRPLFRIDFGAIQGPRVTVSQGLKKVRVRSQDPCFLGSFGGLEDPCFLLVEFLERPKN